VKRKKILILGAGPAGIGAGFRLKEQGIPSWAICEEKSYVGGLSTSFRDESGFTWDIGGHVIFSRYEYFSRMLGKILKNDYYRHTRKSSVWTPAGLVDYPFQNNISQLHREDYLKCLGDLVSARERQPRMKNFRDWTDYTFGKEICRQFILPFNRNMWQTEPEKMDFGWADKTVAKPDAKELFRQYITGREIKPAGYNRSFLYPKNGGTGALWRKFLPEIGTHLNYNLKAVSVDPDLRSVKFSDGSEICYDALISTVPLNLLVKMIRRKPEKISRDAKQLAWNSGIVTGLGIRGNPAEDFSWIYFGAKGVPFFRVSLYSGYSPSNAPSGTFSILAELSLPAGKKVDMNAKTRQTVAGLVNSGIIRDKRKIISRFNFYSEYFYPVPTLSRDSALSGIQEYLMRQELFSRGRFGAWKYELSSMDQSFMMGKEAVDRIVCGTTELVFE